ncbi:MAG: sigma-54-dependent transcriptional regulator [Thermoanaerobaculia bacterium]
MTRASILVVDDDPSIVSSLSLLLKQNEFRAIGADGPEAALSAMRREHVDLVIQDMNFSRSTSGEEGLALLRQIRQSSRETPVILITAWGSIELAVEGMKAGANDFVTKPWNNAQVLSSIDTVLGIADARKDSTPDSRSRDELDASHDFTRIVGRDPKLVEVLDLVARVARTDASVLIMGESGTGKELVAEALHRNSRRSGGPFVKVNLGGISSTLFESEMFGHVRGAFTDAKESRQGRFEVADGGTIFLDEIGDVDPSAQVKLLRVLQDRTYEVLGSSRARSVDVRVVSATNRPLAKLVESGQFREDLLYRLNLITITLPPLRDRRGDIAVLARHFLDSFAASYGNAERGLTPRGVEWLQQQSWPGNVRQLRQLLERATLIQEAGALDVDDLESARGLDGREPRSGGLPAPGSMTLEEMERAMISRCMQHYEGNITKVAEALGLSRPSLYRRLEKYGFETPRP